ncbi:neural cell adhesion molecule 1-A-like [Mustelus asterias]
MTLQARIYTCLLLLGSSIAAKPKLRIEPQAGNIYLNEDKVFLCKADGETEDIRWFDPNDDEIDGENERFQLRKSEYDLQLNIRRAERGDGGNYACKADTDSWGELETSININVIQRVTFVTVNTSLQIDEGQDASLGCRVIGIPQPTVSWRRDGQDVRQQGKYQGAGN